MIQIEWTAENIEEARQIAEQLVTKRLVACAQIIPHIESLFIWEEKLSHTQEVKVLLKTVESHFAAVRDFIEGHSSYAVPEIVKIALDEVSSSYLKWVEETVRVL
eukprot:Opistho-1_new@91437